MHHALPALWLTAALLLSILACGGDPAPSPGSPAPDEDASPDQAEQADLGPLDTPVDTWTWVDVPGAVCGDGSATGVGVNLSDRSSDVVIFMQGGGACWDANTCFVLKSAVNIESGYTARSFEGEGIRSAALFDRTNPANPFKDASYVFIPYCTGDLHAGDRLATYDLFGPRPVHHRGAPNVEAILRRIAPTFAGPRRVLLAGISAGGYGAQLAYHRFAAALPQAEVHSLADSSPMVTPWGGRLGEMAPAWDLQLPPGCEGCATSFPALIDHLATTYPERRFGLLAYDADQTISIYFAYPLDGTFTNALNRLLSDQYDAHPNAHAFILPGTQHVMLGNIATAEASDGTLLRDWVAGWASGAPSWSDAGR
jgi:hypothetical protein